MHAPLNDMAGAPHIRGYAACQLGGLKCLHAPLKKKLAFIQKLFHTYSRFTTVEYANNPANSETEKKKKEISHLS